jgi:internalin A
MLGLGERDCAFMTGLRALEELRLSGGSVESLAGIEGLKRLRHVKLDHCAKLADISALAELPALEKLHVEKCRQLRDFAFLANAPALKDLFVSELDSIDFVRKSKQLQALKFWDLADGNIEPALHAASLKKLDFFPDRKHYTHTKAEANAQLGK